MDGENEVPVGEVAQIIADTFQLEKGIVWDTTKSDGQLRMTSCNKKLRRYLSDFKFSPLRETLEESVKWFIQNYETARKWRRYLSTNII